MWLQEQTEQRSGKDDIGSFTNNNTLTQVGRSNEPETCACGIRQTMQHLQGCPMMDTACSAQQDLTTAYDSAICCARHWEGTS